MSESMNVRQPLATGENTMSSKMLDRKENENAYRFMAETTRDHLREALDGEPETR